MSGWSGDPIADHGIQHNGGPFNDSGSGRVSNPIDTMNRLQGNNDEGLDPHLIDKVEIKDLNSYFCILELNLSQLATNTAGFVWKAMLNDPVTFRDVIAVGNNSVFFGVRKMKNPAASFGLYFETTGTVKISSDEILEAMEEDHIPASLPFSHMSIPPGVYLEFPTISGFQIVIASVEINSRIKSNFGLHGYVDWVGWIGELILFYLALKYLPRYGQVILSYMLGLRKGNSIKRKLTEIKVEEDLIKSMVETILKRSAKDDEILSKVNNILSEIGVKLQIL